MRNKLFRGIIAATLGVAMAFGVGVGIFNSKSNIAHAEDLLATFAATNTTAVQNQEGDVTANVGLSSPFTATLTKNGVSNGLYIKQNDFRMYGTKQTYNGNYLTIAVTSSYTIKSFTFGGTTALTTAEIFAGEISVNDNQVTGTLAAVEDGVYTINSTQFTIYNNNKSVDTNTQVKFGSISITYELSGGGGGDPTPQYSVVYNSNGGTSGTVPADATAYVSGASVTVLGNTGSLSKTGYIWGGWNTEEDGTGTSYSAGSSFNISQDKTLYARWILDHSNDDVQIITADYLNLDTTGITSASTLLATDGMQYSAAPTSSSSVKATNSSGSNALSNEKAILMGKKDAYIYNNDSFQKNIVRVELFANSGASASVNVAVAFSASGPCSSSYTTNNINLSPTNAIYTFNSSVANARYFRVQVTNAYNAQIQINVVFEVPTSSISITPDSITLNPSDTQQLTPSVLPANTTDSIVYSSNNNNVATVSDTGLITAVAVGNATITATSGGCNDTCEVMVEAPADPYILPTPSDPINGYTGQSVNISFTYGNLVNGVEVISNNPAVVTVSNLSSNNGSGSVTFNLVGAGSTTVSFKDGSNNISSISVGVTQTAILLNKNSTSIYQGSSETLTADVNVGSVSWESNNAKVLVDDGVVTVASDAVINSTATITARSTVDLSVSATCVVTIVEDTRWDSNLNITMVADIVLPESGETSEKYYVIGQITEITNAVYGNANAIDEDGTEFSIYGMYSYNGQDRFDKMISEAKPEVGDVVTLYGTFTKFNDAPQIKNARVLEINDAANFTPGASLDLSIDSTTSASTTLLAWNIPGRFSMQVEKAGATADTNNYYPGTEGKQYSQTRMYKNSIFTFTPAIGVDVNKVVFVAGTEGYATTFAGSTFTNATAVANGTLVTVTLENSNLPFTVTLGNTCGFTSVKMYYNQTIKNAIESDVNTVGALSYTNYVNNGDDTFSYTDLAIRFKGIIDKDLWDILDADCDVEGYGMLFAEDVLGSTTIVEWYDSVKNEGNTIDEALAELATVDIVNYSNTNTRHEPSLKIVPTLVGDQYVWALYVRLDVSEIADSYSGVAYIRINGGIVFLNEIKISAMELADDLIESGVYAENAFGGSLKYLAGR